MISLLGLLFNLEPTWKVPAAAGRAASHPATLVDRHRPAVPLVFLQRVRRQVAHLQLCEELLEIIKGHPGGKRLWRRLVAQGYLTKLLRGPKFLFICVVCVMMVSLTQPQTN